MGGKGAGSALIGVRQCNGNVCRRCEFPALLRPFDEADAVGRKQFVQTGIFPFLGHGKAVEVEMVEGECIQRIRFDNGVSRAFDCARMPQSAQNPACQRGFACTQPAFKIDGQRSGKLLAPFFTQFQGCFFIG